MNRAGLLSAIVIVGLTVAGIVAQQGPPAGGGRGGGGGGRAGGPPTCGGNLPPAGAIEKIKDNLYKIFGAGGNTVVFVTQTGVVLVDTKLANCGETILKQVQAVTDKPVTMIINTHSHPDHMGSNGYFPWTVEKITHVNTRKWMANNVQYAFNPAVMPTRTFTDKMTVGTGPDRIDLYWFGPGHTDGDAFIVFPALRTMMAGDIFAWNMAPLIDPGAGGSVVGLPDTLEKTLKGVPNVDTVIEGHGDVNTWEGFKTYAAFNRALLDATKAGLGTQAPEAIANSLKAKFPVQTHEKQLPGMEYGGTPLSRAVINVSVACQELKGERVTTNFAAPKAGAPNACLSK
jgi:glyoxylase-like metal-dependent hydrolase (beta-lactamase superfamily II)